MVVNQKGQSCRPGQATGSGSFLSVLAWAAVFSLVTGSAWSEVLSLRCGITTTRGVPAEGRSLPDLPFNVERGYGFIGGKAGVLETAAVRGLRAAPRVSWRAGESKYVFKLKRGEYLVTLDFIETEVAAAGLRIFDVEAEGKVSIEGLDIFDEAGDFSLLQRSFRVGVFDGWLDLQLVAVTGDRGPRVSGIRIEPFSAADSAGLSLGKPVLSGRSGLFRNTLAWKPPVGEGWGTAPLAGFNLYRSKVAGGPFAPVNDRLLRVPYLVDRDLVPGTTYYYRVQSQDIAGTRSSASAAVALEALSHSKTDPKIYDIRISDADFRRMATREGSAERVPAEVLYMKGRFPAEIGFDVRPGSWLRQKNLVVDMSRDSFRAFRKRDFLLLSAEEPDFTRMRRTLTSMAAGSVGLAAGLTEPVIVLVNGRFFGLRYDVERIDSKFRKRTLLDRTGPLSRLTGDDHWRADWSMRARRVGKSGDLLSVNDLVRQLNRLHPGEIESFFRSRFYLGKLIDRLAFSAVRGELDPDPEDLFLLKDSRNGKWEMFRQDYSGGAWGIRDLDTAIRDLTPGELERALFPLCQRSGTPQRKAWMVLFTRFFNTPALRELYLQRVESMIREELSAERFDAMVDRAAATAASALEHSRLLSPGVRVASPGVLGDEIKAAHRRRTTALKVLIDAVRARPREPVMISSYFLNPASGSLWVELRNRSDAVVKLADLRFSGGFSDNPRLVSRVGDLAPGTAFRLELPPGPQTRSLASGGSLVLWRRVPQAGIIVSDFVFFGHQGRGVVQKKVPAGEGDWVFVSEGEKKSECPSPFYSHEVVRRNNGDLLLSFRLNSLPGGSRGQRPVVELMYRPVGDKAYEGVPMTWDEERHRYLVTLQKDENRPRTEYYYRARGTNGLERAYPLGAPVLTLVLPVLPKFFINEVCPRPGGAPGAPGEFIEIINESDRALSLKGLYLSDDRGRKAKWCITDDIVVKPGGYEVFYGDGLNQGRHTSFKLSNSGEFVGLYTSPHEGSLLVHGCAFRGVPLGNSWGRKQDGSRSFRAWKDPTPGKRNLPKIPEGYLEKLRARQKAKDD